MPERKNATAPVVPSLGPNIRWLLVEEAAAYLRVSPQTIRWLIHNGQLKAVRGIGQGYRIDKADLDLLVLRRKKIIPPYREGSRPWVARRHAKNRKKRVAR